jgi:nicotinamidase-related amidase
VEHSETRKSEGLRFGPLTNGVAHVCVDMQRLFADDTPWKTPWMNRVLPNVVALVGAHPHETVFTRFIPAARPTQAQGAWQRYWARWEEMTLETLPPEAIDLIPQLARFAPPATVIDKPSLYSPWFVPALQTTLETKSVHTLLISGGETDVCVLATVLGAVDRGYRVVVISDALCSSSDETHDALMRLYGERFSQQIETALTQEVLANW